MDFIRIITDKPLNILAYCIQGKRLETQWVPQDFMKRWQGWYHPATAWEIEEYRRLGGM
jgi:hypothetical protein